jgi:hypothetical protein
VVAGEAEVDELDGAIGGAQHILRLQIVVEAVRRVQQVGTKKVLTWHKGANMGTRGIRWKSGRALNTRYCGYSRVLEGALGVLGVLEGCSRGTRWTCLEHEVQRASLSTQRGPSRVTHR